MSTYYLQDEDVIYNFREICNGVGEKEIWEAKIVYYNKKYKSWIFDAKLIKALFLDNNKYI